MKGKVLSLFQYFLRFHHDRTAQTDGVNPLLQIPLPLQTILREILATLQVDKSSYMMTMADNAESMAEAMRVANVVKYCVIVVATGPVVILYGFMQKYFEKGVMIGSLKG